MGLQERVYSVLVVSSAEKFNTAFEDMLPLSQYQPVHMVTNAGEAKRCIAEREFDFVVINAPLPDESGIRFAMDCCRSQSAVVLMLIKSEGYGELCDKATENGVFTLCKPVSRVVMQQALSWMASARERLRGMEKKNISMEEKMEQIRLVNRAKWLLISELKMSESEAHHYIEKSAMDGCVSKKDIALGIIKTYT